MRLAKLKEELADLEQQRAFMLGKTTIHVPGSAVGKYNKEIEEIKGKIQEIEAQLQTFSQHIK